MKRRTFLATAIGALFAPVPAWPWGDAQTNAARPVPRTVAELRVAIESLFAGVREMQPVAYEENAMFLTPQPVDYTGATETAVYRIVPATWWNLVESEADGCAQAWAELQLEAIGYETGTLIWRTHPTYREEKQFEGGIKRSLRIRYAIEPVDWQQRAQEGGREWRARNGWFT